MAAQVLSVANANLIAIALPPLSADLGASPVAQLWIVDAYVLVFAALLIAGGVAGDRYGRRRALLAGFALFTVGSLACSLAEAPGLLIGARVIQGLGPPLVLPASLAIVAATYQHPGARAKAIGVWGAGSGIGVAAGPLIGGVVVEGLGWRWAFGFNVPVAMTLALLALRVVPADGAPDTRTRFDGPGAVLVTLFVGSLVFGIIEGADRGWGDPAALAAFAAAVALGAATVVQERRAPAPLIDLALLGRRTFAAANVSVLIVMFALLPVTVLVSAYLQRFAGDSALEAGLSLVPNGIMVALAAAISGRLTARLAPRTLMVTGLLCACAGVLLLARTSPGTTAAGLAPALLLVGAGAGIALPAATSTAVGAAPVDRAGMAAAIHNACRQLGATLGIAVLGSIVLAGAGDESARAFCDDLRVAMLVGAAALAAAALLALVAIRSRPRAAG